MSDIIRPFETRYYLDGRTKKPITKGFPKSQDGVIKGASNAVMRGLCYKVQCIDRNKDQVLWTVHAGQKVPGLPRSAVVVRGEA